MEKYFCKKILAFIFLSILISLNTIQVFATQENQIGDYIIYDSNGEVIEDAVGGSDKVVEDGSLTMSNSIEQVGIDEFEITLNVQTQQNLSELKVSTDAAVVLAFDISGSMLYCDVCGGGHFANPTTGIEGSHTTDCPYYDPENPKAPIAYEHSRMIKAIKASKDFMDEFVKDAVNGKRMVSIVFFAKDATHQIGWIDINDSENGIENLNAVKDVIESAKDNANSWTSQDAGLMLAHNLYDNPEVADIDNRYAILLTDGTPTTAANNSTSDTQIVGKTPHQVAAVIDSVKSTADTLKTGHDGKEVELYTVAYSVDNVTIDFDPEQRTIEEWLIEDIATDEEHYVNASDGDELNINFNQITESILSDLEAYKAKIEVNSDLSLNGLVVDNPNVVIDGNSITWDLLSETPVYDEETGVYNYELSYTVMMDSLSAIPNTEYPVNTSASLNYYKIDEINSNGEINVNAKLKTEYFNVPTVIASELYDYVDELPNTGSNGKIIYNIMSLVFLFIGVFILTKNKLTV